MRNPWNVCSIYDLQYFNCPSCVFRISSKQEFINHAYEIFNEKTKELNCNKKNKNKIIGLENSDNTPIEILDIYNKYKTTSFLDFSAVWCDRLIAAMVHNCNYIGTIIVNWIGIIIVFINPNLICTRDIIIITNRIGIIIAIIL